MYYRDYMGKMLKLLFTIDNKQFNIVGSLRDQEVACSASDYRGPNFELCVWRAVPSQHPQEVLLAQFILYVHKGGLKPHTFHFISCKRNSQLDVIGNYLDLAK